MKESKKKTILFICGCLENGKDGVGDYTRTLAHNLINKHGYNAQIAALSDNYVDDHVFEQQDKIDILRISNRFTNRKRHQLLISYIHKNKPDIVSLQFVPFSFHPKGLPFRFITKISRIKDVQWHIMFHELWVGMEKNASIKIKLLGSLQFLSIKTLIKRLKPKLIHSSNPLYIYQLKRISKACPVKELPLLGNIRNSCSKTASSTSNKTYHIVLFAGIHHGAPINSFIHWLQKKLQPKEYSPKFTFIGNNGQFINEWIDVLSQNNIEYQVLGIQDNNTISKLLANADLGISTTPYYLSNKSGSNAAMLEHQLTVLCVARDWIPDVDIDLSLLSPNNIIQWHLQQSLDEILKPRGISINTPSSVSKQFINDLNLWPL